jgi:hypothetical protein
LAPKGAGLFKLKVFWCQKAGVILRLKISGMIVFILNELVVTIVYCPKHFFGSNLMVNFKVIFRFVKTMLND